MQLVLPLLRSAVGIKACGMLEAGSAAQNRIAVLSWLVSAKRTGKSSVDKRTWGPLATDTWLPVPPEKSYRP